MPYWIGFEPLLPLFLLVVLGSLAGFVVVTLLFFRRRGAWLRILSLGSFILALANPLLLQEVREPLKAIVAVIVDRSPSQNFGQRIQDTDNMLNSLQESLAESSHFEMRLIEMGKEIDGKEVNATYLLPSLQRALADVPPSRQGGIVLITDGQLHDVPISTAQIRALPEECEAVFGQEVPQKQTMRAGERSINRDRCSSTQIATHAPINALITGEIDDYDRRLHFVEAPAFGLVDKNITVSFMVIDEGKTLQTDTVLVDININGAFAQQISAAIGHKTTFSFKLPLAGTNVIEASVSSLPGELTQRNNQKNILIEGIHENLNVLLVSGEPHNGVRLWRDLLKSDTGVDLIHFTILRPPEKSDNTPVNELSLIAFPTTELFVDKIDQFDLIILDRYQHYDVLPLIYYDYIAQYVENGGALLMVTGPEYADFSSLAHTPLISVLPALPTGEIIEAPFLPQLTQVGAKHPVTNALTPSHNQTGGKESWGRWLRQIDVDVTDHEAKILLQGAQEKPLLLLAQKGEGRVGMLLSDQSWLWARGFDGGGPYATLYRRVVHWLMKQPNLEEEALFATARGNEIKIRRQTMEDVVEHAQLTLPSGQIMEASLNHDGAGHYSTIIHSPESGFVRVDHGPLTTLVLVGKPQTPEFDALVSTTEKIADLVEKSGGNILRLRPRTNSDFVVLPLVEAVADNAKTKSDDKIILRKSTQSRLLEAKRLPLYPATFTLFLTLILLCSVWYRESH